MLFKTLRPLLLIFWVLSLSCKNKENSGSEHAFALLSEEEKRKPENALQSMEVADGLKLSLFASEPMVSNPTNMAIDVKGRIWVCEGRNYRLFANPNNTYDDQGDRILILEDTDGDGTADSRKVFYQGEDVNSALGIVVLGDKIIVSVSPNVLIFTDSDGDDVPDSKEVLFTGIEGADHDHGVHAVVFGPDGRLYFNYGNNGKRLLDKEGRSILDIHGDEVVADGNPYREGMVFRMDPDGKNIEVLAHNFRNPYELAMDSHGNLWQSDNDDDGNQGTRLNFLLEYGNYGFKDKLTGSNWRERRPGWSEEIPKRHWHLNDPGTVPNLLQTGSGSPTGILVYEDRLLPKAYQNKLIHCEPGHNVVRAYGISEKGAGYEAKVEDLVGSHDDWFRPSDVTVAPDGSLFICDWYDGGVGGHKAEDLLQGRIYHLSLDGNYRPAPYNMATGEDASKGLLSGNMDMFYRSWQYLNQMGEGAEPHLSTLMAKGGTAKARALWIGVKIPTKTREYINLALSDKEAQFRIQGIRMARYMDPTNLEGYLTRMVDDESVQVRREVAIALKNLGTTRAAELWAALAKQYQGGDRWYLEALGIGSDKYPNLYFRFWKTEVADSWKNGAGKEIVWRVQADATVPLLAEMIRDKNVSREKLPSYFRAFSFKRNGDKNAILMALLENEHPLGPEIQALAIGQLDEDFVNGSHRNMQLVKSILPNIEGTPEWLVAIKNLKILDQKEALLRMVSNSRLDEDLRNEAGAILFASGGKQLVADNLESNMAESDKMEVLSLLGNINNPLAADLLVESLGKKNLSHPLKRKVVEALGNTWDGQHRLYALLEKGKLAEEHKTTAVLKLMNSWDNEIRENAPSFLDSDTNTDIDVDRLMAEKGNVGRGREIYEMYCSSCHVAGGTGIEFGPALSDIGNKLSKQFLYSNIISPSAGISFGYEGYSVKMRDSSTYTGYILGRTEDDLTLNMMGGVHTKVPLEEVADIRAMDQSLMTEGLHKVMREDELVDLVEYLTTLKVKKPE